MARRPGPGNAPNISPRRSAMPNAPGVMRQSASKSPSALAARLNPCRTGRRRARPFLPRCARASRRSSARAGFQVSANCPVSRLASFMSGAEARRRFTILCCAGRAARPIACHPARRNSAQAAMRSLSSRPLSASSARPCRKLSPPGATRLSMRTPKRRITAASSAQFRLSMSTGSRTSGPTSRPSIVRWAASSRRTMSA